MTCGKRYRARSTTSTVTYYYPTCQCGAEPIKRPREIDLEKLDPITRRVVEGNYR